jgi:hypothetical protein
MYDWIETQSERKAAEMGLEFDRRLDCEYMHEVFNHDSGIHTKE